MDSRTRLYLDDPYALEFEASILERRLLPGGRLGLVLDRTCFYPTSGGQPHDLGFLGPAPVVEVVESEDGAIVHCVERDVPGGRVQGRVDGPRRRDHMQQHSGQHLLSATCLALAGRATLSFHLGAGRCTIDLGGPAFTAAQLAAIEMRTNEIVWEGREVRSTLLPPGEANALRKPPPAGAGLVRVVEIADWDRSPCCGTHVRRTHEIGLVKVLAQERIGAGTRLHFMCGRRALEESQAMQARVDDLVRLLTCHPDVLVERCTRLTEELKSLRHDRTALQAEVAALHAAGWLEAAPRWGGVPVVVAEVVANAPDALRHAAAALVEREAVAILGQRGERAQLLFARPESLDLDLRPAMAAACELLDGRGGGPPARVQGAGSRIEALGAALEAARDRIHADLDRAARFDSGPARG